MSNNNSIAAQLKAAGIVSKVMQTTLDGVADAKNTANQALSAAVTFAEEIKVEVPAPRFDGLYEANTAKREAAMRALNAYVRNYMGRVKNTILKREVDAFDTLSVDLIDKVLGTLVRLHEGIAKAEAASKRNQISIYTKVMSGRGGVDELQGKLVMSGTLEEILEVHTRSALDRARARLKRKVDEAQAEFVKADTALAGLVEAGNTNLSEAEANFNKAKKQVEVAAAAAKLLDDDTDALTKANYLIRAIYKMDVYAHHAKQRARRVAQAKTAKAPAEGKTRQRRRNKGKGGNTPAPKAAPAVEATPEPTIGSCGADCTTCPAAATCGSTEATDTVPAVFADRADDYNAYLADKGKAPGNPGVLTRWVNARKA